MLAVIYQHTITKTTKNRKKAFFLIFAYNRKNHHPKIAINNPIFLSGVNATYINKVARARMIIFVILAIFYLIYQQIIISRHV